ncbi:PDZK1-interacting protein 1 isoform X2 [Zalophus californianus]|uniref:PDZK1-interacting protein 1 n=1 Tax=Zalophus californianus TaxID=9704 RepID=A0A6J2BA25_ZALCA|nr:PDZK1-interacting protein 1 isoform X2 [Zalophus californianus]
MGAGKTSGKESSIFLQDQAPYHMLGSRGSAGQTRLSAPRLPGWKARGSHRAKEPGDVVMTVGNKADGILVGTDGRYSSMAASFSSSEHKNAYENVPEEEGKVRSTPM